MKWGDFLVIKELNMKNFGKFHHKIIPLHKGINLIYGENETGKTTIYYFIKSMFFDIEKKKGKAAQFDTYHLYEPWENQLFYEGELKFEAGGRNFRIERGFHKNQKKEILINEDDAEELSIEQGDLLHILDGLNETIFKNTLAIGQLQSQVEEKITGELKNYTSDISLSGDGGVNVARALDTLAKRRKEKESKLRDLDNKRRLRVTGLHKEKEYVQTDLIKKENQLKEYTGLHKTRKEALEKENLKNQQASKKKRLSVEIALALLIVLGVLILKPIWMKALIVVLGLIIETATFVGLSKISANKSSKLQDNDGELNRLEGMILGLKEDIHDKEVQLSNLDDILMEENRILEEERVLKMEISALEMAHEGILSASYELQKEISDGLNKKASQILSFITSGKYEDVRIDEQASTRLNTRNKIIYEEEVSKGTMDGIHFAVRMAFLELFFPDEKMPVILDDAFAMYDDNRLQQALRYLEESNRQVILFTCQKREEQLLKQLQIPYHKIELSN